MNRNRFIDRELRAQAGFTLVELMIALVLTVVLAGAILAMHSAGRITFLDVNQMSRIQENVRFASDYMIRDIRNAGFRDETFLRFGHEQQIVSAYAQILDNAGTPVLRVRYAGRGSCTEAFDEFRLVENEYTIDINNQLTCRGRSVGRDEAGDVLVTGVAWDDPIGLVEGITGIDFKPICPADAPGCVCDATSSSCIGVTVALQFEGLRAIDGDRDFEPRAVELTAAFRNIILDRVNADAWGGEES